MRQSEVFSKIPIIVLEINSIVDDSLPLFDVRILFANGIEDVNTVEAAQFVLNLNSIGVGRGFLAFMKLQAAEIRELEFIALYEHLQLQSKI